MSDHHVDEIQRLLISALDNYNELNPSTIDDLSEEPSPLEFMRYVSRNRPFVVRGAAKDWTAIKTWDAARLCSLMGDSSVRVAITPRGNADSIVDDTTTTPPYSKVFVEPLETTEPFSSALKYIISHSRKHGSSPRPVKYLQTQNDNLRPPSGEYSALWHDLPRSIPYAHIALQQPEPDAVNFWLGSEASTTALHRDNYENVYVQVRGRKHFILLPPVAAPAVMYRRLARGRYVEAVRGEVCVDEGESCVGLKLDVHEKHEALPVPTWDPVRHATAPNVFGPHVRPVTVTLDEGDTMYLPALWYHHVRQSNGTEGFNCSVNYWYDMDFSGNFWTTNALLKDIAELVAEESLSLSS